MELTLNAVSERTLRLIYDALLPEYESAEQALEDATVARDAASARFEQVKDSMAKVKGLLYPITVVYVRSRTSLRQYAVRYDRSTGHVTCECPSFEFNRGLVNGTCKHIREAINERGLLSARS